MTSQPALTVWMCPSCGFLAPNLSVMHDMDCRFEAVEVWLASVELDEEGNGVEATATNGRITRNKLSGQG
jgi:hypothetical protein